MSCLIRLNNGAIEKHTLTLGLAMCARGEAKMVDASHHRHKLAKNRAKDEERINAQLAQAKAMTRLADQATRDRK